jgi:hypothetical protein
MNSEQLDTALTCLLADVKELIFAWTVATDFLFSLRFFSCDFSAEVLWEQE